MKKVNSLDYIKIAYRENKILLIAMLLISVICYAMPTIKALALANFIDKTIVSLTHGVVNNNMYISLAHLIFVYVFEFLISSLLSVISVKYSQGLNSRMEMTIVQKISSFDYEIFENEHYCDLIDRVKAESNSRFYKGISNIMKLLEYVFRMLGIVIVIATKNIFTAIVVLLTMVVVLPVAKRAGEDDYMAYEGGRKHFRRAQAYRQMLVDKEYADERTLFSFSSKINKYWSDFYFKARKLYAEVEIKNNVKTNLASIVTAVISVVIALLMIPTLQSKAISSGLYISIIASVFELIHMMSWNFADTVQDYISNNEYLSDYYKFVDLDKCKKRDNSFVNKIKNQEKITNIKFEKVSFKYPNSELYALNNFSYDFSMDKHYAIVGENGAGKTTLVKLLLGLYKNYSGKILINNRDLKTYTDEEINSIFSVVYQDYVKYQMSVRDNIAIGCKGKTISDDRIIDILKSLDIWDKVNAFHNGLDTFLGKLESEGIDLSGGEWQKIAIARSLVSDAGVYILDEPTASLDPISEKKLYDIYKNLFKDRSSIIITHRLGNTKNVDCIVVLNEGTVCEMGSHNQLMELRGKYYSMYEKQRSWYDE